MDVANLIVNIDSRSAKTAAAALGDFDEAASAAEEAADALAKTQRDSANAAKTVTAAQKDVAAATSEAADAAMAAVAAAERLAEAERAVATATGDIVGLQMSVGKATADKAAADTRAATAAEGLATAEKVAAAAVMGAAQAKAKAAAAAASFERALAGAGNGAEAAAKRMRNLQIIGQQLGFQLTDVFTQISMGGNVMQALTVQGGQMLGFFGLWGAAAGVVVTIMGTLWQVLGTGKDSTAELAKETKGYQDKLDALIQNTDSYKNALKESEPYQQAYLERMLEISKAAEEAAKQTGILERAMNALYEGFGSAKAPTLPGLAGIGAAQGQQRLANERMEAQRLDIERRRQDRNQVDRAQDIEDARDRRMGRANAEAQLDSPGSIGNLRSRRLAEESKGIVERNKALTDADKAWAASQKAKADAAKREEADTVRATKTLEGYTAAAEASLKIAKDREALWSKGASNSIELDALTKANTRLTEQAQIEEQLRGLRGRASAEAVESAKAAMTASADAKRTAEEQMKLTQDQYNWELKLRQERERRQQDEAQRLKDLQAQTAQMQFDDQRAKVEELRATFMSYGQVAFDALYGVATGAEKATDALKNMAKQWAQMAFQMASQMALQAMATALFPMPAQSAAGLGAAATYPRAGGGDVEAGRSYIVGEHGRERFTPATNGRITSNRDMKRQGRVVNQINAPITIQLSGPAGEQDADRVAKAIDKRLVRLIDERTVTHARNGGFG